jgi:two-component system nitrogen regulation response regulator GlnG
MPETLLVVDDDEANCRLVKHIFTREGFDVLTATDGQMGMEVASRGGSDVVLLDLRMPGIAGLDVLAELKSRQPTIPVIMLTGSRDVADAVKAIKLGAVDYVTKPYERDELVAIVRRALETRALRLELQELRQRERNQPSDLLASQMGPSAEVKAIVEQVRLVAASNFTVLVLGETGTGKELVAHAIHNLSDRRRRSFVALDCGAIPEPLLESELFGHEKGAFTGAERRTQGQFRLAEGGTCFLDEVANLPGSLQAKLLRVLESRQVQAIGAERATPLDVRFVTATNDNLQLRVEQGMFRADLYFRLAQYTIVLPPLRQRPADIEYLAQRFAQEASVELRIPIDAILPDTLEVLRQHDWPGNVRELRNVVRQAVLQSGGLELRPEIVRAAIGKRTAAVAPVQRSRATQSLREIAANAAAAAELDAIQRTLRETRGNKSQAARLLSTDYKTLHVKMKQLGVRAHEFKE